MNILPSVWFSMGYFFNTSNYGCRRSAANTVNKDIIHVLCLVYVFAGDKRSLISRSGSGRVEKNILRLREW